jgi:hypothetical protein
MKLSIIPLSIAFFNAVALAKGGDFDNILPEVAWGCANEKSKLLLGEILIPKLRSYIGTFEHCYKLTQDHGGSSPYI